MSAQIPHRLTVLLSALAAAFLAGCTSNQPNVADDYVPIAHYDRFPISVTKADATLEVPVKGKTLTAPQENEAMRFIQEYGSAGSGPLVISRPSGSRTDVAAASIAARLTNMMALAGIPAEAIEHRRYTASGYAGAPVVMSYQRTYAVTSQCGDWSENVADNYNNTPMPNFGCAQQHNLAAMVANPNDLVTPRAATPADAMRRMTVFDAYRKGQPTATERGEQETGIVSDVQ